LSNNLVAVRGWSGKSVGQMTHGPPVWAEREQLPAARIILGQAGALSFGSSFDPPARTSPVGLR